MKLNNPIAAAAIIFLLGGCGNWDAIYRKHDFADNKSAITDIKSRAIITTKP
ncbi:hypothetical protein OF113_14040 [Ectopseudomonas chengduensis]|nr:MULTISPECIES: hypothetical protein [Pseudomonas]MDZ4190742.1 hypothetical protein [Pseudomonas sp.]UZT76191.1 hypothetical protein OF113_14040 [Pseudomonas chengduensis]